MSDFTLNEELRRKTETSLKPEQKVKILSNHYLLVKYPFMGWHVIGFQDRELAATYQQAYLDKGAKTFIADEYPYEVMLEWKKETYD